MYQEDKTATIRFHTGSLPPASYLEVPKFKFQLLTSLFPDRHAIEKLR